VPELEGLSSLGVDARDVSHMLVLEVRNRLLLPTSRFVKRFMDLFISLSVGIVALPVILLIIVLIRLDSKGPVLYRQLRIGCREDRFSVWKFRTMAPGADQVLSDCLEKSPELKREWQQDRKLRNDPRITRVGRFLRKSSLDE